MSIIFRSQGMGLLQISSRIGAAGAPWVAKALQNVHKSVPFLVMGVSSLIAALLLVVLPETKGAKTAEVLESNISVAAEMTSDNIFNAKENLYCDAPENPKVFESKM